MYHPFIVAAIPLNRPSITRFLTQSPVPAGAPVHILDQRPTLTARRRWARTLNQSPTLDRYLQIHDPHHHLTTSSTGRLIPRQFLDEPGFLTRNLGGWTAIYFGVMQLTAPAPADPLLNELVVLAEYGPQIPTCGHDVDLTAARLEHEVGLPVDDLLRAAQMVERLRQSQLTPATGWQAQAALANYLLQLLDGAGDLVTVDDVPIPRPLLLDALLDALARVEAARRAAHAAGHTTPAEANAAWQADLRATSGTQLILKGEYIMGRHRRSTILLMPSLGVVVKQPGLEPLHEAQLAARTYQGQPENWPTLSDGGALVTPAGRIRLTVEEGLLPRLFTVCNHAVLFSTLLGLSFEALVPGPTFQEYVLEDPRRLSAAWYEEILLHQQVCEVLGIENGDWHSANFIVRHGDGPLVHVDWGAARLLRAAELTPAGVQSRLNQVRNIAFSFHDEALAARINALHDELVADPQRMDRIRQRARTMANQP